jgi:hypothetical protein
MHIQVETKGSLTYGETVANRYLLLEAIEDAGTTTAFLVSQGAAERPFPCASTPSVSRTVSDRLTR